MTILVGVAIGFVGCSSEPAERAKPQIFAGSTAAFYRVPELVPDNNHGTLIRYQRLPDLKHGRVFRMMYTSRSVGGDSIFVTGLAVIPQDRRRDHLVLSWAHATAGIA